MNVSPANVSREQNKAAKLLPPGVVRTFVLISGLFFLWGVPNNLNDILIRQFMKSFAITRFQAGLVQSAFYLGYFTFALPAGLLMKRFGYKAGFITGLLLFASGCFLFLPASSAGRYGYFLAALFVVASGLAFLETAANPFVAQLGPTDSSERRLNLAQAFNPIGAILGVLVGTVFIFSGVELTANQVRAMTANGSYAAYLHREILRVVAPYLVLGTLALLWCGMILATRFPAFIHDREESAHFGGNWRVLFVQRHFLYSIATQFMYVGAQVGTWSYFIQYAKDYVHISDKTAGLLLACTLGMFGLGRFISAGIMKRVSPGQLMMYYAFANVFLILVGICLPGYIGLVAVLLTSFFMSIMFPTIFAMGLKDLGPNTNIAGSILVMAIIGGAVLTPLMGLLAEHLRSTAAAYSIPLLCYLIVAAFSRYMRRYSSDRFRISRFDI
jgi:FHS family L-fucose permease-like MFS transporter